jgi:hypothetical protein
MPSRSAVMAAVARAAHLEVDRPPFLFEDVLVRRLLGSEADALLSYHHTSGAHPLLMGTRLVVTTRARYAENRLADAVSGGIIDTAHAYRRGMLATGGGWLCRWSGHQPYRLCCTRWACPAETALLAAQWSAGALLKRPPGCWEHTREDGALPRTAVGGLRAKWRDGQRGAAPASTSSSYSTS